MENFKDQVYIVTGAANGQGRAEVRLLARLGARVLLTDIDEENGTALAKELPQAGFIRHDVSQDDEWAEVMRVATAMGPVKGLVNNAGIYRPASIMNTSPADFEQHFKVNQLGCFLGMRSVLPVLQAQGGGAIVNIGSTASVRGSSGSLAYCATKWAMRGMSQAVAKEFGPANIRVNTVLPGPISTDMLSARTPEQNAERMRGVPLQRFGTPEEVADLVVYLLSDQARFITGAEILIDGGVSL